MRKPTVRTALAAALVLAIAAAPAAADWLVLTDGSRVETRGTWEVRGGLAIFTLGNGTLSSLRASDVDLEASAAATEAEQRPAAPAPPPAPKPKAKMVLTEKDLPPVHAVPEAAQGESEAEGGARTPAPATPAAGDARLVIVDWDAATPDTFDGTVVTGRLRNVGQQLFTRVVMEVLVYNAAGTLLARAPAELEAGPMAPDRVFDFAADEAMLVEHSCKYSHEYFAALAARAGLRVERRWVDPQKLFSVQALVAARA